MLANSHEYEVLLSSAASTLELPGVPCSRIRGLVPRLSRLPTRASSTGACSGKIYYLGLDFLPGTKHRMLS